MSVYWIWLAQLKGISLFAKHQLLKSFSSPRELFEAEESALPTQVREAFSGRNLEEARQIVENARERSIGILPYGDAAYPENLRNIPEPPLVLYYKGTLPNWQAQPFVGMVGTRKASPYGTRTAALLASQIAVCGGIVVSGAAAGIDKAAMEGALSVKKPVVGVVGGGVDVVYPAANRTLYRQTEEHGCLISEYPPGSRPYPACFLQRNRIISGISQGVVVVEAPERSGALNTAQHAFTQGRDLFAVPANLDVESGMGSNTLLQEGAYPVFTGWDVMKHYAPLFPDSVENRPLPEKIQPAKVTEEPVLPEKRPGKLEGAAKKSIDNKNESTYSVINERPQGLSEQEALVFSLLGQTPQLTDSLLDAAGLPAGTVQSILIRLSIKGLVKQYPDGSVSRK